MTENLSERIEKSGLSDEAIVAQALILSVITQNSGRYQDKEGSIVCALGRQKGARDKDKIQVPVDIAYSDEIRDSLSPDFFPLGNAPKISRFSQVFKDNSLEIDTSNFDTSQAQIIERLKHVATGKDKDGLQTTMVSLLTDDNLKDSFQKLLSYIGEQPQIPSLDENAQQALEKSNTTLPKQARSWKEAVEVQKQNMSNRIFV